MKIVNRKLYASLIPDAVSLSFFAWLLVILVANVVRFYEDYGVLWGSVFSALGSIFILMLVGLICLCLPRMVTRFKMRDLSILIDEQGGLAITNRLYDLQIPRSSIKHIMKNRQATTLVWFPDARPDWIRTFTVQKHLFPAAEYNHFVQVLSTYECFIDDREQIRTVSAEIGLDRVFRRETVQIQPPSGRRKTFVYSLTILFWLISLQFGWVAGRERGEHWSMQILWSLTMTVVCIMLLKEFRKRNRQKEQQDGS